MIGEWKVQHLPLCTHHVFLSHCAEDRTRLVLPVYRALEDRKLLPWLDQHHYPSGQGAYEALREGVVHCRHVVFLVTSKFLSQGRGWSSVETAYSTLLQENLRFRSLELCHIQLPLFFVSTEHPTLRRSAWGPLAQRGRFYRSARLDRGAVDWATREIFEFVLRNEVRGRSLAKQLQEERDFQSLLNIESNLLRRIACSDPPPTF